jgi:predicted aconitase with swiveling domain
MSRREAAPDAPCEFTLEARRGLGAAVVGTVLVSSVPFSARYDLDRTAGLFSRLGHPLAGQSIAGRVLVFPGVQGGVAAGWAFLDLKGRGLAPLALVFGRTNPVMVQGAVLAGLTLLDGVTPDPVAALRTGDLVQVDPGRLRITVLQRPAAGDAGVGPKRDEEVGSWSRHRGCC